MHFILIDKFRSEVEVDFVGAPTPALEDLPWASAAAFGKAQARGLSYDDFEGHEPTGKTGYRAADVTAVANAKEGTP